MSNYQTWDVPALVLSEQNSPTPVTNNNPPKHRFHTMSSTFKRGNEGEAHEFTQLAKPFKRMGDFSSVKENVTTFKRLELFEENVESVPMYQAIR